MSFFDRTRLSRYPCLTPRSFRFHLSSFPQLPHASRLLVCPTHSRARSCPSTNTSILVRFLIYLLVATCFPTGQRKFPNCIMSEAYEATPSTFWRLAQRKRVGRSFPGRGFVRLTDCGYFCGPVSSKDCLDINAWRQNSHNPIESMFSTVRDCEDNLKRYRGSRMAQRWLGAVLLHCEQGFKRVKGYAAIKQVVAAMAAEQAESRKLKSAA